MKRFITFLSILILIGVQFQSVLVAEADSNPTAPAVIEAENMVRVNGQGQFYADGNWQMLGEYGYLENNINFPADGSYKFTLRAFGQFANNAWPIAELRIDSIPMVTTTVGSGSYADYTFFINVSAGTHVYAIAFTNDYYVPPADRNLIVDKTTISLPSNIYITATLNGQLWNGNVNYSITGPNSMSGVSVPSTFVETIPDSNYTLTYQSGGPTGAILHPISPISPVSSQFLPEDVSIAFNLNFVSGSTLCPIAPQANRTIVSFEPYQVIGSPDYAQHMTGPYSLSSPVSIGTYNITLVAYDNHTGPGGSGGQNQPNEKYYLKLLKQNDDLVISTNSTSDIPNDQDFVTTLVNTNVEIPNKIHKVEAWHSAYIDNSDYNSLYPICAAFDESFDYSLSNSGTSSATKTTSDTFTQNTITKTLTAGDTQDVSLSVSGVPPGVTTSISGQNCNLTCTSVITFTVSPDTIIGTYPITVTGSPLNQSTNFNLVILGDPLIVSCTVSPTLVFLGDTVTLTANVSGGTPPYIYSWEGTDIPTSPSPDINPFDISYNTVGQKSASVTVTDSSSPPFQTTCPTVTVRASIDPNYKEF